MVIESAFWLNVVTELELNRFKTTDRIEEQGLRLSMILPQFVLQGLDFVLEILRG